MDWTDPITDIEYELRPDDQYREVSDAICNEFRCYHGKSELVWITIAGGISDYASLRPYDRATDLYRRIHGRSGRASRCLATIGVRAEGSGFYSSPRDAFSLLNSTTR
jgi:hypothetical protein